METSCLSSLSSLSNLDGLADLAHRGRFDIRPTLLRVLTDLYVQKLTHTFDEDRRYTELALRLLDAVDVPTRIAVATRLARHLSPPLPVMRHLRGDLPEIAALVRSHQVFARAAEAAASPQSQQSAPLPAVAQQSAPLPAVAQQSAPLSAVAQQSEPLSAVAHSSPPAAAFDDASFSDPQYEIEPAPASELNEMFFAASAEERRLILLNLHIVAPLGPGHVDVTHEPVVSRRLETAALGGDGSGFVRELSRALRISRELAQRIARDGLGEPIAVAAKALGISRDVAYRILMFVNPIVGHSVERVHALAALYDDLNPAAAAGMVEIWQALPGTGRTLARHQPLLWNDETRMRVRPVTTVRRARPPLRPITRRDVS